MFSVQDTTPVSLVTYVLMFLLTRFQVLLRSKFISVPHKRIINLMIFIIWTAYKNRWLNPCILRNRLILNTHLMLEPFNRENISDNLDSNEISLYLRAASSNENYQNVLQCIDWTLRHTSLYVPNFFKVCHDPTFHTT